MDKNSMILKRVKITFLLIMTAALSANSYAQKQDASAAVKSFYQFHFSHDDAFGEKEVLRRRRFFTSKLQRLFNTELKRQKKFLEKYPDNKPFLKDYLLNRLSFAKKITASEQRGLKIERR